MPPDRPDRRRFLRLTLAGTAAGLAAASAPAQDEKKPDTEPDPLAAEVDARRALILARYGVQLDEKARESVRKDVESVVKRARRLREFPLTNGDGPFLILVPYRAPAD
jgi:hypothetical protein